MSVREYELVLMLDPETPEEQRNQITAESRQRIEGKGSLKTEQAWGMRKLAYEIHRRTEADYRFFRFASESPLLDELDHNLKITDGVLRFRIFKVDPDAPVIEPPPAFALAAASRGPGGPRRGEEGVSGAAPATAPPPAESASRAEAPAAPAEAPPSAEAPPAASEPPTEPAEQAPAEGTPPSQ